MITPIQSGPKKSLFSSSLSFGLRNLCNDQRGTIAVMTGLCATALVGFAALAIDVASWQVAQRSMQGTADAAAYSAAFAYSKNDGTSYITQAKGITAAQGYVDGQNGATVTVNRPPASGSYTANAAAVEVIVQQPQPRFLAGLLVASNPMVKARAVAAVIPATGNGCVLALDPTASGSIAVSGSGTLTTTLCDVVANSTSSTGITISGSANISTPCIVAGGTGPGVSLGGSGTLSLTKCPTATTGAPAAADPYASAPTPAQGPTQTNTCGTGTMSPGYYPTGISIGGSSTCTFSAGVYYVNGSFSIGGSATVTGTGVTIFTAAPGAGVSLTGSASITLSAPTSGTYAGIVFFGDRTGTPSILNTIGGSASFNITGAIYFPAESVKYSGSSGGGSSCTQLIADKIQMSGSATFADNHCAGTGVSSLPVHDGTPGIVQVIE
jgi:Flp pilus assembly protein TadG